MIATPGRLREHIEVDDGLRKYLLNVRFLVLDEADRLLEESILPDVLSIASSVPER